MPFGDIDAMERALSGDDVAAVIIGDPIPATYGFPLAAPIGYLEAVKDLTDRYGASTSPTKCRPD